MEEYWFSSLCFFRSTLLLSYFPFVNRNSQQVCKPNSSRLVQYSRVASPFALQKIDFVNQVFQQKSLFIKPMNVNGQAVGRNGVEIRIRSITLQPLEIFL